MREHDNNITDNLLAKYLDGSATQQECTIVDSWKELSSENKAVFEGFKKIWLLSDGLSVNSEIKFDKSVAFQKILTRIEEESPLNEKSQKPSQKISTIGTYLARIAAVLVIGLSIFFIYRYSKTTKDEKLVTEATESQFIGSEEPFIVLPDGSTVNLKTGGEIKYATSFDENRTVELNGEAFFNVPHLNGAKFKVSLDDLEVAVIGTSFYIIHHPNDSFTEIGVKSGNVNVLEKQNQNYITLHANEMVRYDRINQSFDTFAALDNNVLFWKTGILEFDEQPLDEVLSSLSMVYETRISFQKETFESCLFTARFQNATLIEIIEQIRLSFDIEVHQNEAKEIVINGKGCE